jgi:hypothetical protein
MGHYVLKIAIAYSILLSSFGLMAEEKEGFILSLPYHDVPMAAEKSALEGLGKAFATLLVGGKVLEWGIHNDNLLQSFKQKKTQSFNRLAYIKSLGGTINEFRMEGNALKAERKVLTRELREMRLTQASDEHILEKKNQLALNKKAYKFNKQLFNQANLFVANEVKNFSRTNPAAKKLGRRIRAIKGLFVVSQAVLITEVTLSLKAISANKDFGHFILDDYIQFTDILGEEEVVDLPFRIKEIIAEQKEEMLEKVNDLKGSDYREKDLAPIKESIIKLMDELTNQI